MDPLKLTCSQQLWLHSSVGRALHRYRRGHGFESRWSLNFFFRLLFRNCLNCVSTAKIFITSEIVLYEGLKTGLQSSQSSICLFLDYLQTLKYKDSNLIETDLFAFGPTINLPASNEPWETSFENPDLCKFAAQTLSSSRTWRIKPSSPLTMLPAEQILITSGNQPPSPPKNLNAIRPGGGKYPRWFQPSRTSLLFKQYLGPGTQKTPGPERVKIITFFSHFLLHKKVGNYRPK